VHQRELREDVDAIIILGNTYHLYLRPGLDILKAAGGLHGFNGWERPLLTDSGGFQVFSLAENRKLKEEGCTFRSHIDGARIFMGPEQSMQIQSNLGSTIAMAFDECPPALAERSYVEQSVARTTRWLARCQAEMKRLNALEDTVNREQLLFGINQGAVYQDIRTDHARAISEMELDGYAIGGLAVGETHDQMYDILDQTVPHLPADKPTYLMGVGTPENIIEAVDRGIDFFDCVYPSRNGRHGNLYTKKGTVHIKSARYAEDPRPIEEGCGCPVCRGGYSRAYLRHLYKAQEALGLRMGVMHNLYYYNHLMEDIRNAIDEGRFAAFKKDALDEMHRGED
jgi:queuine tRNA-ribosyltransferase